VADHGKILQVHKTTCAWNIIEVFTFTTVSIQTGVQLAAHMFEYGTVSSPQEKGRNLMTEPRYIRAFDPDPNFILHFMCSGGLSFG
jgi:hypothetical protein